MKKVIYILLLAAAVYGYLWYVRGFDPLGLEPERPGLAPYVFGAPTPTRTEGYWLQADPMPTPRTGVAAATVAGRVCVVGGVDAWYRTVATVECLDVRTGRWTIVAPLPQPRNHVALAEIGGKLYAAGGLFGWASRPTDSLYIYDPQTDRWSEGKPIPKSIGGAAVAVHDGKMHLFGGRGVTGALSSHWVYDPGSGDWMSGEEMLTVRDRGGAAAIDDSFLVFGGLASTTVESLSKAELFNDVEASWDAAMPMPSRRGDFAMAYLDGRVFVFGGLTGSGVSGKVDAYDVARHAWIMIGEMPQPLHAEGAAAADRYIFIVGGGPRPGWSLNGETYVFVPPTPPVDPTPEKTKTQAKKK
ncbi:MAG: kelch repeat-containing protein [Patescibacteria group bacterium]|nr:kelch repeat-containing protein [Patescibacteria group bacterium]